MVPIEVCKNAQRVLKIEKGFGWSQGEKDLRLSIAISVLYSSTCLLERVF